jgi:hypothetical protein
MQNRDKGELGKVKDNDQRTSAREATWFGQREAYETYTCV